jgi:hypothetical protein
VLPRLLFFDTDWHDVVRTNQAQIRSRIEQMNIAQLNARDSGELASAIATSFDMTPPTLVEDDITLSQREADIDVSRDRTRYFGHGPATVKGVEVAVTVPFSGRRDMFLVKPTTWDTNPPRAELRDKALQFYVRGVSLTPEEIKREIQETVTGVKRYLEYQGQSAAQHGTDFVAFAREIIAERKAKLAENESLISNLGYKTKP